MNKLNIVGASGHGKVVADIAMLNGYKDIVFLDDDENIKECNGIPVAGKSIEAQDGEVFVAIGNPKVRKRLMEFYCDCVQPVLIHPKAVIAGNVTIGSGTAVMAGTVVNSGTEIGQGVIVNTSSSIDHDCSVGDYSHISVGAHLCGTVKVGDNTWIGAGATVINNVNICGGCIIGAGAVVIKDIDEEGTYIGVPAKKMIQKFIVWGGGGGVQHPKFYVTHTFEFIGWRCAA